ncbi:MAG TPA: hypothetical protein VJ904_08255, partial [Tichowtungia sp.]|nr:hypothetical protein [Tichowtungia sp.]
KTDTVGYWDNGTAEWTFHLDQPVENINLMLEYAAPDRGQVRNRVRLMITDVVDRMFEVKLTQGWNDFNFLKIAGFSLPKGTHTLSLSYEGEAEIMKLNQLLLTEHPPEYFTDEYPPLFELKTDWAETMTALRTAYRKKDLQNGYAGRQFNRKDGKALWAAFPKESDWFLQDNQVHGEWGRGLYDARKDYKHYLNPDRDSTLEKKLIEKVLREIDAPELRAELDALNGSPDDPAWLKLYVKACGIRRRQRLAPLLKETQQIVYATHMNMGIIYLETETQGCPDGSQLRIIDLTPEADGKPLTDTLLFDSNNGIVRDPELSFDGKKLLFAWRKTNRSIKTRAKVAPETGNYKIYEMDLATRNLRQLTDDKTYSADFEPCYLPSGDIMFSSARCVQEVTCGWGDASNLFIMDKDGKYARRVGFDQTQTAFPHLLNDGRVVYTRRDYNDRGQSYAHALFVMNPDGTKQTEYYGNNSMAPTSIQHTRPIPGSRKTMGVAGGYHTTQGGKLVTIDVSKGRQNYDGLTFYNWEPTPLAEVDNENYCR